MAMDVTQTVLYNHTGMTAMNNIMCGALLVAVVAAFVLSLVIWREGRRERRPEGESQ